jgi:(1->4)-alpha-D-glucan 1-alpha-D-glucosylmutase
MPLSLLASSTHDSKRGEDVRIRICGLTEMPQRWSKVVKKWFKENERFRSNGCPDPKAEYLFYQTVVGAWPLDPERGSAYMLKAAREAKEHTSWTRPVESYEKALRSFVEATLGDERFRSEAENFVRELQGPARVGSLAQTLIKLTAPGVPDLYQGTELWHLYLVDPDNRRAVDYRLRNRLLHELNGLSCEQILERSDEGLPKLWVIRESLAVRRKLLSCFSPGGSYRPLTAEGERADCLVAYERGGHVVVLAPRLPRRIATTWGDTAVNLPEGLWRCRFGGHETQGGRQLVEPLLRAFPVGLYVRETAA